jgi:hypothetical protein
MTARLALPLFCLAAGCFYRPHPLLEGLRRIHSSDRAEREDAFQIFTTLSPEYLPQLKAALPLGAAHGFPLAAILYVRGEGDAVPLEIRVRHLAAFRWPRGYEIQNAIVEPFVWNELERDVVKAGRPALRLLADALSREAPDEEKALGLARVMLQIGGRGAAEELARLLDVERDLGGVRVGEVAAAGLLRLGWQELALRLADRKELVRAAKAWWEKARGETDEEWLASAAAALAERWKPGDVEGLRPVLELLVGEEIADVGPWRDAHSGWRPSRGPLEAKELLPRLSQGRAAAFDANRRLETLAAARLDAPRARTLGELCASLRLWRPPADLGLRWRRFVESVSLRLTVAVLAPRAGGGPSSLLAAAEKVFHVTEDAAVGTGGPTPHGDFMVHVQSRDLGARIVYNEHLFAAEETRGTTREHGSEGPVVSIFPPLSACIVATLEESGARAGARPPEALLKEVRARLRAFAGSSQGEARARALRALGYAQDPADAEFLKAHRAGEALLLLGDPAGLEFEPRLEPHEIEMALRRATDPRLRAYIEGLRKAH